MINMMQDGGPKACNYGCLGEGSCVAACPFDAIHIVNGVALVDKEACKACGKCIEACPKKLIELVPYEQKHLVQCSSRDKGKDVMAACSVGCIGCKMCEKVCEFDAVKVIDNIAHIILRNVQTAENAQRNVQRRLFSSLEKLDETIFQRNFIRWDKIIYKRYQVSKMGDYFCNRLFCFFEKYDI